MTGRIVGVAFVLGMVVIGGLIGGIVRDTSTGAFGWMIEYGAPCALLLGSLGGAIVLILGRD